MIFTWVNSCDDNHLFIVSVFLFSTDEIDGDGDEQNSNDAKDDVGSHNCLFLELNLLFFNYSAKILLFFDMCKFFGKKIIRKCILYASLYKMHFLCDFAIANGKD